MPAPPSSSLAYEDEPHWAMVLREYVIPGAVFAGMLYYLLLHVLLPMRRLNRPTRQAAPTVTTSEDGGEAPSSDPEAVRTSATPAASAARKNK